MIFHRNGTFRGIRPEYGYFFCGVQPEPFATILFGMPIPSPTSKSQCWIRGLHEASTQGIVATTAKLHREAPGVPWVQAWDAVKPPLKC